MRRVVVTGIGLLTTLGASKKDTWNNLISGHSGIKKLIILMLQIFLAQ
jgi:3-oxoacyl-(acyl-carrier-protein) synthase